MGMVAINTKIIKFLILVETKFLHYGVTELDKT